MKMKAWRDHGATIAYLTSKKGIVALEKVRRTLHESGAPDGELFFRKNSEHYGDAAERTSPDLIVEDDCRSIGGETEMVYPKLKPELRRRVKSVIVAEFGGIDHLPDNFEE